MKEINLIIPNKFIRQNIEALGCQNDFLITYLYLYRNRNLEGASFISGRIILDALGKKRYSNGCIPKEFKSLLKTLKYLEDIEFLKIESDLSSIRWDSLIQVKINKKITNNYTTITTEEFDRILQFESITKKTELLLIFLYVLSYIGTRKMNCKEPDKYPLAFFRSLQKMADDLSISYPVVVQAMKELSTGEHPLLKKKTMSKNSKYPNIYVLNQDGWEKEMEYAVNYVNELKEND